MKFFMVVVVCSFFVASCQYGSEKFQSVMDDPMTLLEDPLTVEHKEAMTDLERAYLNDKISYGEYLEKKRLLEEDYAKEVQHREDWIE